MTDIAPPMAPGCWGSAVFYAVDAPVCVKCPVRGTCARHVRDKEIIVLEKVGKLDKKFGSTRSSKVRPWFETRWKERKKRETRDPKRAARIIDDWKRDKVNVFLLRSGTNPARKKDKVSYETFRFIMNEGPFKPQDLVECLREKTTIPSKNAADTYAREVCAGLVQLGVLKKESRGVHCLA